MSNGSKPSKFSGDFYRRFLKLGREDRRSVAVRILRNQRVVGDLYDHFLIQEAMQEPGADISWKPRTGPEKPAAN
ncbi:MAG TPA: hypothetical protein VMO17_05835 [Terriglobia bacterium]|nr:hypothetical protein [Terriglobia bacterium]